MTVAMHAAPFGPTLLAALGALAMLAGCRSEIDTTAVQNDADDKPSMPALPAAEPPLDRAKLLQAVAQAASSAALGSSDAPLNRELDGDRFELRMRFGCPTGSTPGSDRRFGVTFDQDTRTLRLRATLDLTEADPWLAALAGERIEAIEGFWLRRPWLLSASCPQVPTKASATGSAATEDKESGAPRTGVETAGDAASASPPAGPRVGIAQFFTEADARTARRSGRSYEAIKVLGAEERPSRRGYDLVLSGRLTKLPSGQVIACRVESSDTPPDCVISADIDRVRFEHPETRAMLSEWSN